MVNWLSDRELSVLAGLGVVSVAVAAGIVIYNRNKKVRILGDYPVKITSPFGYRIHPVTGKYSHHNGVDIAAPVGTPVYAPFDGKVVKVWEDSINGIALRIKHDRMGIETVYCHLSRVWVHNSRKIKKGNIIAFTGNSGMSTGAHLHLGVWHIIKRNFVAPKGIIL